MSTFISLKQIAFKLKILKNLPDENEMVFIKRRILINLNKANTAHHKLAIIFM